MGGLYATPAPMVNPRHKQNMEFVALTNLATKLGCLYHAVTDDFRPPLPFKPMQIHEDRARHEYVLVIGTQNGSIMSLREDAGIFPSESLVAKLNLLRE